MKCVPKRMLRNEEIKSYYTKTHGRNWVYEFDEDNFEGHVIGFYLLVDRIVTVERIASDGS